MQLFKPSLPVQVYSSIWNMDVRYPFRQTINQITCTYTYHTYTHTRNLQHGSIKCIVYAEKLTPSFSKSFVFSEIIWTDRRASVSYCSAHYFTNSSFQFASLVCLYLARSPCLTGLEMVTNDKVFFSFGTRKSINFHDKGALETFVFSLQGWLIEKNIP